MPGRGEVVGAGAGTPFGPIGTPPGPIGCPFGPTGAFIIGMLPLSGWPFGPTVGFGNAWIGPFGPITGGGIGP